MVPRDQDAFPAAPGPTVASLPAPAAREELIRPGSREATVAAPPGRMQARLVSLDAYRGFIMLAMASAGFYLWQVAKVHYPHNTIWQFLRYQTDHVAWTGCGFWDLIQPAFMFMVGVAMPFSYASRRARGDSYGKTLCHAGIRALVLVLLGVFLSSNGAPQTNFTFVNVLTQIGLGYLFVYLLINRGLYVQFLAAAVVLAGYWYLFYQHPLPDPSFNYAAVRAGEDTRFAGVYAHWNKNANYAADADLWFLNLFPHTQKLPPQAVGVVATAPPAGFPAAVPWPVLAQASDPELYRSYHKFRFNEGGYQTLNFVPSIATMIFGLMAGELLRTQREARKKFRWLVAGGLLCLLFGLLLDYSIWPGALASKVDQIGQSADGATITIFHVCPIVKRIWSPTWAVFSTGWALLMLAAFYWVIDLKGYRRWAFPLVVVGMNSITMYCMSQLMKPWIRQTLRTHLGQHIFDTRVLGPIAIYEPIVSSAATLLVLWLICLWLYRQKIFVRI